MGEEDETEPLVQAMHRQLLASQLDKLGLRRLSTKRHQETGATILRFNWESVLRYGSHTAHSLMYYCVQTMTS